MRQSLDQRFGGGAFDRAHLGDRLSRRGAHRLVAILQQRHQHRHRGGGVLLERAEGPGRRFLHRGAGVRQHLDEGRDGRLGVAAQPTERLRRLAADRFVGVLQTRDQARHGDRRGRSDTAQRLRRLQTHGDRGIGEQRFQRLDGDLDRVGRGLHHLGLSAEEPADRGPGISAIATEPTLLARRLRGVAAEDAERFGHALAHEVARIRGQRGNPRRRLQGVQSTESGDDDRADMFVAIVQMAQQARNRRRTDGGQDLGQLVALLLRERRHRAQRHQERTDRERPILRQGVAGPVSRIQIVPGLQKSAIVSVSSFPWRSEAKICCRRTSVKNALKPMSRMPAGHFA